MSTHVKKLFALLFAALMAWNGGFTLASQQPASRFFATVSIEDKNSIRPMQSDGDLWPSCWSDDGALYAANGDGKGFGKQWFDIVVNRIEGTPEQGFNGVVLASGDQVARVWSDPERYNRKPTGMLSVDGVLYLAVQDLNKAEDGIFDDAPAASIYRSSDKGASWTGADQPMFDQHTFTTMFFLDNGQDNQNAKDEYVYIYGMDNNWRDSFKDTVPDPMDLYLARVHKDRIQDRASWTYFAGRDAAGNDLWQADIANRQPVLHDERRVYADVVPGFTGARDMSVISQGSVVYNKPLDRYIYSSWTEYTFELYEAPAPSGPFSLFYQKDFGGYAWSSQKCGGYAATIPSKFISEDGRTMWIISSTFAGGAAEYRFSARKLSVSPYRETAPQNQRSDENLAIAQGVVAFNRANRLGRPELGHDGDRTREDSSWTGELKREDFWGYVFEHSMWVNEVCFTTGDTPTPKGGWFCDLRVQVRRNNEWTDVQNLSISPAFDGAMPPSGFQTYTLCFDEVAADGIRIIGTPGGTDTFTSMAELEVRYR